MSTYTTCEHCSRQTRISLEELKGSPLVGGPAAVRAVAKISGHTMKSIRGRGRGARSARVAAMILMGDGYVGLTQKEIGTELDGRDHSTVCQAVRDATDTEREMADRAFREMGGE